jgi:hypothetical protein
MNSASVAHARNVALPLGMYRRYGAPVQSPARGPTRGAVADSAASYWRGRIGCKKPGKCAAGEARCPLHGAGGDVAQLLGRPLKIDVRSAILSGVVVVGDVDAGTTGR